jgi:hypothetical protein
VDIMLARAARDADQTFRNHVRSVVLIHPSYSADVPSQRQDIHDAVAGLPLCLGWARNDQKMSHSWSSAYLEAKTSTMTFVQYETGEELLTHAHIHTHMLALIHTCPPPPRPLTLPRST